MNHPDEATLLNIAEKFELSRQKRQTGIIPINTGFDGKNLARIQVIPKFKLLAKEGEINTTDILVVVEGKIKFYKRRSDLRKKPT